MRVRFVLLSVALVAVGFAGFVGYVVYPRFDLPRASGLGLTGLAAAAGLASFFSPCSFPLLVTLLVTGVDPQESRSRRIGASLRRAAFIGFGAATFVLALGLLIAGGGAGLAQSVTFNSVTGRVIRGVVGGLLVGLGLIQVGVLTANFRRFESGLHDFLGRQARLRRRSPGLGHAAFGFGYLAAGFG